MSYYIFRHFKKNGTRKFIKKCRSRKEAEAHCENPETRKEGEYFDGWVYLKYGEPKV